MLLSHDGLPSRDLPKWDILSFRILKEGGRPLQQTTVYSRG